MTGSKDLVVYVHKIPSMPTNVKWGDASSSKVLGLGKVVISHDLMIEKVMLVECYLLSIALVFLEEERVMRQSSISISHSF